MYRISIRDFEGPLDLLLFFIRRDELDIFDIPIASITDEYLEYVRILEEVDLDSVGEFLYMAAMLINIKARMLLPRPELDDEGEPVDPRRELVERLLEYVRYKEASHHLARVKESRDRIFTRGLAGIEQSQIAGNGDAVEVEATIFDLVQSLRGLLTEAAPEPEHALNRESYTIEEQQEYIMQTLADAGRTYFVSIVFNRSRAFIITTFLAILELARQGMIALFIADGALDFQLEASQTI